MAGKVVLSVAIILASLAFAIVFLILDLRLRGLSKRRVGESAKAVREAASVLFFALTLFFGTAILAIVGIMIYQTIRFVFR